MIKITTLLPNANRHPANPIRFPVQTTDRKLNLLGLRPTGDLNGLTAYTTGDRRTVWFVKSPPTKPPSEFQRRQRQRFTCAAQAWRGLTGEQRDAWNYVTRVCSLYLHGYDLFVFWQLIRDPTYIRTLEHQTGKSLIT